MNYKCLTAGSAKVQEAIIIETRGNYSLAAEKYMEAVQLYSEHLKENLSDIDRECVIRNLGLYTSRAIDLLRTANTSIPKATTIDAPIKEANIAETKKNEFYDSAPSKIASAVLTEAPNVKWGDIIGLEDAKIPMQEAVLLPILFPRSPQAQFAHKGILLFGPGGVGKTQICKAMATEAKNATFINVRPDMLLSKWVGESEQLIRELFSLARQKKPSIIFMDEVDSLCSARGDDSDGTRRFKNSLLCEMDGMDDMSEVFIIGATNQPYALDTSFLRRFPRRVYVSLPGKMDRINMFDTLLKPYKHVLSGKELNDLASITEGYSGADIKTVITEAGMYPYRDFMAGNKQDYRNQMSHEDFRAINSEDVKMALMKCSPANTLASIRKLEDWNFEHGSKKTTYNVSQVESPGCFQTFKDVFGVPL